MTGKLCWESSRLQQWTDGWWCCSVVFWHGERLDVIRCALWWWTWHITQAVIMWEPGGNELEDNSEISSRQCVKTRQFEACINTLSSEIINSVAINTKPSGCHVSLIWICKWSLCWGKYTKLGRGRPKSIKQRWFVYEKLEGRLQMMILMVTACEKN